MEVVSLGLVLPFLGVLVSPEHFLEKAMVANLVNRIGINTPEQLVIFISFIFAFSALAAGVVRIFLLWFSSRVAFGCGADIGSEIYRRLLHQVYEVHASRNSSEVISVITNKVDSVVFLVLMPLLNLLSSSLLFLSIILALFAIHPMVATFATVGFGGIYLIINHFTRRRLRKNSECIVHEQTQVIKTLQEGLGGIRDILLDGSQHIYYKNFRYSDYLLRKAQGNNQFIAGFPRPAIESIGMFIIAFLAYSLSIQEGSISTALPVLGALALGAQRLLPAMQQSYGAWVSIFGSQAALGEVISMLNQPMPKEFDEPAPEPLLIKHEIELRAIKFRYSRDTNWVLDDVNLKIPIGIRVGFIGSTGSGKSTMLDLLMGLLCPSSGELIVDGQIITGIQLRAWQKSIAHVPQNIYLADATIAENIAFGVPQNDIDMNRVKEVAYQSQIKDFIEQGVGGYQARLGERGVRLSGGQRQRIGIARALYKRAQILVLDEATSSLDSRTENLVMDAIDNLGDEITVLMIAHRLTTLKNCQMIVKLENGKIIAIGTYDQLINDGEINMSNKDI